MAKKFTYFIILKDAEERDGFVSGHMQYLCRYRKDAEHAFLSGGATMSQLYVYSLHSRLSFNDQHNYYMEMKQGTKNGKFYFNIRDMSMKRVRFLVGMPEYIKQIGNVQ